jgi:flavin-dependent dehydrogenase
MSDHFDVVVVGARCAGAPLAARLARKGMRVCVVERSRFPSEVPSTHMIQPNGVASLGELGLLEALLATGAPPIEKGAFQLDDVRIESPPDLTSRVEAPWLCIRRSVLDPLLAGAAEEAGAEVRTGTAVTGLVHDDGVVRGVVTHDGPLSAPLVVGADGPHSVVARRVGAREYHVAPPGRTFLWGYFEGVPAANGMAALGKVGDLGFLGMHTDAGLFIAGVAPPAHERGTWLHDVDASLEKGVARIEVLGELLSGSRRVGAVRTLGPWHGYFREAAGPGWVLVGDAGHFKDPTPAQGIADALRQGERLADTIERGLGGPNLSAELGAWWRWRDDDAWDMYWFATDMGAAGESSTLVLEMMRSLGASRDGAEHFLRLLNHEVPPAKVFTTGLALRTMLRVAATRPSHFTAILREAWQVVTEDRHRRRLRRRPRLVGAAVAAV